VNNSEKLRLLFLDVFLLRPEEFRFDMRKDEIETWDSLGVVSLAVGVKDTFGYHLKPEEAVALKGVEDLIAILEREGLAFNAR
jgi:acyl carrier protein